MVKGLDVFRSYFEAFRDNYIIIGGTACDIVIDAAGFVPRATKDIDIVLIVEALNREFVAQFWNFIKDGQYAQTEKNEDERKYYRFRKPANPNFPYQVELFSRTPDLLDIKDGAHLTPIPIDDDISNLSAILMNDDYYNYTLNHCTHEDGLQRANIEALICLKAKAFLDMIQRKEKGEQIDEKQIRKHKSDVFRLAVTLTGDNIFKLSEPIQADMQLFAESVKNELPEKVMFKEMGLRNIDPKDLLQQLVKSFQIQ